MKLPLPGPRERALHRQQRSVPPTPRGPRRAATHWLYWFYSIDGELLYIGITNSGVKRMEQHGADKEWWPEVSRIDVEHYPSRADAEEAERDAIRAYRPRFNGTYNTGEVR